MAEQKQDTKIAEGAATAANQQPAGTETKLPEQGMNAEDVKALVAASVAEALKAQAGQLAELQKAAEESSKGVSVAAALKVESEADTRKPQLKKGDVVRAVFGDLLDVHTMEKYHHGEDTLVKTPSTWLDGQLRAGKLEMVEG